MRMLVFDTETTGLPGSRIINPDTLKLWPHIVQFSYVIYDTDLNDIVKSSDNIIRVSNEIIISEESSKIHGITSEISKAKGVNIDIVLNDFFDNLRNVDLLIGHNVSFDINMVKVEILRLIYASSLINPIILNNITIFYTSNEDYSNLTTIGVLSIDINPQGIVSIQVLDEDVDAISSAQIISVGASGEISIIG